MVFALMMEARVKQVLSPIIKFSALFQDHQSLMTRWIDDYTLHTLKLKMKKIESLMIQKYYCTPH